MRGIDFRTMFVFQGNDLFWRYPPRERSCQWLFNWAHACPNIHTLYSTSMLEVTRPLNTLALAVLKLADDLDNPPTTSYKCTTNQ